ncbi:conserved hypothetical protein [Burkholderia pseudomallei Pakistan 9]|nr:conserved hypothetical protein [Burkholderia pseudomallei Pakistan 9]
MGSQQRPPPGGRSGRREAARGASPGEAMRSDSARFGAVAVQCVRADLAGLVSLSG